MMLAFKPDSDRFAVGIVRTGHDAGGLPTLPIRPISFENRSNPQELQYSLMQTANKNKDNLTNSKIYCNRALSRGMVFNQHDVFQGGVRMFENASALTNITGKAKSLRGCRKGAAATELALILPLLTTMILAVFEYGAVVYSYSMMQFGANRVARTIAVNRMTTAQAQNDVRAYFPGWVRNDVNVSVTQSNAANVNVNLVQVQLSVPAQQATPLAILTRLVPWQLSASVTMKQELPYVDD